MRRHQLGVVLAAGIACAMVTLPLRADIYKWVDERGAVTYSDHPPKDRGRIKEVFRSAELPASPDRSVAAAAEQQSLELRLLAERVDRLTQAIDAERGARYAALAPPAPADLYRGPSWDYWPYYTPGVVVVGTPFGHRLRHFDRFRNFDQSRHFHRMVPGSFASRGNVSVQESGAVRAGTGKIGLRMR